MRASCVYCSAITRSPKTMTVPASSIVLSRCAIALISALSSDAPCRLRVKGRRQLIENAGVWHLSWRFAESHRQPLDSRPRRGR